jgi:hypothetical protein
VVDSKKYYDKNLIDIIIKLNQNILFLYPDQLNIHFAKEYKHNLKSVLDKLTDYKDLYDFTIELIDICDTFPESLVKVSVFD